MKRGLKAYGAILRLVRKLPQEVRPYYAKYTRENFVNYREMDDGKAGEDEVYHRAYTHAIWVLNKYSVDEDAAADLKKMCSG
ncbi:LYR motif-containing protein [Zostera marina]|uniref:LYR motif-containing protein n=1 Tax=Zostera marina TaxID=29655 RepID=A0A0K9PSY3_ZOSMR|nr:LYR motif-containing protein [Zostera marina]